MKQASPCPANVGRRQVQLRCGFDRATRPRRDADQGRLLDVGRPGNPRRIDGLLLDRQVRIHPPWLRSARHDQDRVRASGASQRQALGRTANRRDRTRYAARPSTAEQPCAKRADARVPGRDVPRSAGKKRPQPCPLDERHAAGRVDHQPEPPRVRWRLPTLRR